MFKYESFGENDQGMSSCDDHGLVADPKSDCGDMAECFPCEWLYANKLDDDASSCANDVGYNADSEFSEFEDDGEEFIVGNASIKFANLSFYQHKRTILLSQYKRYLCK